MKVVCISDTHNKLRQIDFPEGDILIHAGDFTNYGTESELLTFREELKKLNFEYKVIVPGNHDWLFERENSVARELFKDVAIVLEDESTNINGLKFYGTPWSPWFHGWARNLARGKPIREKWDLIPNDVDVLITHTPPMGILDQVYRFQGAFVENTGCADLLDALNTRLNPKLHVFGHIHEGRGTIKIDDTMYINAASYEHNSSKMRLPFIYHL